MKKFIIFVLIGIGIAGGVLAANNLWEYYNGNLPSISVRGIDAEKCGIQNYTGTAEQNNLLLNCLQEETFGQPYAEEPWDKAMHFAYEHSFDAGIATLGVERISKYGDFTMRNGELTGTFSASGSITFEGAITSEGTLTATGALSADANLVRGGSEALGYKTSSSFTAAQLCDVNLITLIPTTGAATSGDDGERGASMSFPDDETLVGTCLGTKGDEMSLNIINISSGSAYIDLVTTGLAVSFASKSTDFDNTEIIKVNILNVNGSSLSWRFDAATFEE